VICHMLQIHLISHHAICFSYPLERKVVWSSVSVSQGDCHCHQVSCTGPSCRYLSAAVRMLQTCIAWIFWERMWICVSVCEYLVHGMTNPRSTKLLTIVVDKEKGKCLSKNRTMDNVQKEINFINIPWVKYHYILNGVLCFSE
jgi:hypothetical protein